MKSNAETFALGDLKTARLWAQRRGLKLVWVVPPRLIGFETLARCAAFGRKNRAASRQSRRGRDKITASDFMTPSSFPDHSIPSQTAQRAIFWTIAAFFLALTVRSNGGRYAVDGMVYLSICIACMAGALWAPTLWPLAFGTLDARRVLNPILALAATLFAAFWIMPDKAEPRALAYAGSWLACAIVALILTRLSRLELFKKALFPIFLGLIATTGASTITKSQRFEATPSLKYHVSNDVQKFNEEAARLLLSGQNPYSTHMPNVMDADYPFYPPGVTRNGRLPFGYPYMPLSAGWILPGYLLGDTRWMHLVAVVGAAGFLGYARLGATSKLAATVFALFPSTLFVLMMSWTEPVAVFFLAATLWCYFRAPKWLFLALGCLFCAKQYTIFLLPLLPLLVPEREQLKPLIWKSLAVAAVLTLPMALWDVAGFSRSVVEMQFKQPFRLDSLSYLATLVQYGGPQLSPLIGFGALFAGLFVGLKKLPRQASSWPGAGALAFLGFFAWNKQAFANYYFWVFALLMSAVAVALPDSENYEETR